MKHIIFEQSSAYPVAILIKEGGLSRPQLERYYVNPAFEHGIENTDLIAFSASYQDNGKAPVGFIKEYLAELLPVLRDQGTKYLYVTDSAYYKVLTKNAKKSELYYGYVTPCAIEGFEDMFVVLGVNHQVLLYKPQLMDKISGGFSSIIAHLMGKYEHPGSDIIEDAVYPTTFDEIKDQLDKLHNESHITADIEAFSLSFFDAGIGTIAFGTSQTKGIAFSCDYAETKDASGAVHPLCDVDPYEFHGFKLQNKPVRALLKRFFETYKGCITWHRSAYDLKVLIYTLWMDNPLDMRGMLEGLEVMTRHFGDTKIIAYLALNSTTRSDYSLKSLAQEYAGSWAIEEIKDIRKIKLKTLLTYNTVDALCTYYVNNKYYPVMVGDKQEDIYKTMMLPSQKVLLQTELCGMPMDQKILDNLDNKLSTYVAKLMDDLAQSPVIQDVQLLLQQDEQRKANAKLKVKQHPLSHFANYKFNPNSVNHLQKLLFEYMELPALDFTDTGAPSTGGDVLEKLQNHTTNKDFLFIIETLISYSQVEKIVSSFLPAFKAGTVKADGMRWLHGSFNIGGTVSGRLSSSEPKFGLQ